MKGLVETVKKQGKYIVDLYNKVKSIEATTDSMPYKVYTALLTQSGGSSFDSVTSGELVIGVTYQILDDGGNGWDFTNVGAPNNDLNTYFVATGTTPANWGNGVYLEYNTGAPVVTVLENTIGNVWFTYESTGFYSVNSDKLFIDNKTISNIGQDPNFDANGNPVPMCQIYNGDAKYIYISSFYIESGGVGAPKDDMLTNGTPIEIRVYN